MGVAHELDVGGRLGPNSFGEELSPGAVDDCYLGLLVGQPLATTLPAPGSLVVVGPSALLEDWVRQPDGWAVYDLLTGHPDRSPVDAPPRCCDHRRTRPTPGSWRRC
ncbi:MAG: hypothetical protein ACJ75M_20440 [Actinomycetes bacterium]